MPPLSLVLCAEDAREVGLACRCDEELGPDLTSRVDALSQDKDSSVNGVLHGDDLALPVTEREVVVEEPLAELVGSHVLDGFRQDLAEGTGGNVSFCCFDGPTKGCDRALGFDFCFGLGACRSFFLEGCREPDDDVRIGNHLFDGGWCGVHAVLADGGEDLIDNPCFELFCFRELGVEDQSVEVAFGDEAGFLCASEVVDDGVMIRYPLAVTCQCVIRILVSEGDCYVLATEKWFTVLCRGGADISVLVGKDGDDLVRGCSPSYSRW